MTHANALDIDLSLRIAPELYLKRLVVGGYERVFEIARNFRNEGVDTRHSPEFTALEAYRAFGDVTDGMDLTERLIVEAARAATGRLTFRWASGRIDLTPPWPRRQLLDWLEEVVGHRLHPDRSGRRRPVGLRRARRRLPARVGIGKAHLRALRHHPPAHGGRSGVRRAAFRSRCRRWPGGPPTTRRWPTGSSWPSTPRSSPTATASSTSPRSNRSGSGGEAEAVARGDLEAHPADVAFVRALEYGLPPTSGIGIGVDRLVMLLAEVEAIRDVILFPMMRPEAAS